MKILFIAGGYPTPDKTFRGIFNARAVKALSKEAEVIVCHYRYWRPGRKFVEKSVGSEGNTIYVLALPWIPVSNAFINAWQHMVWAYLSGILLKRQLKSWNPDVVHSVNLEMALIGKRVSKKLKSAHFSQVTGSDIIHFIPAIEKYWPLKMHWRTGINAIICNSRNLESIVKKRYPECAVFTCYRGVDCEVFNSENRKTERTARKQFLFLGGFSNRKGSGLGTDLKGGEFLKELWSALDQLPDFDADIKIGGPESRSGATTEWRDTLQKPENVDLIGDMDPATIPSVMKKSDILLLPSRSEGLPNVVVEAMASGMYVIASDVGGVSEIITSKNTGTVLPSTDRNAWIEAMKEGASGKLDLDLIGSEARKFIEINFNSSTYGNRLIHIYTTNIK
ncbi:MAG: glycosyltransferase [Bacteroidetes bacterium]|nr:glycosyltransferase [Bacteroidota bacterium]